MTLDYRYRIVVCDWLDFADRLPGVDSATGGSGHLEGSQEHHKVNSRPRQPAMILIINYLLSLI